MGYWKSKFVPAMKKLFERSPTNKDVVVEASKTLTFDNSKEAINKEIEEKKTELEPKVLDIYEATSAEVKALVREPKEDDLTKHSAEVQKFLEALVEIGFPGSKDACELSSTSSGPVTFIFEKVCVFLPVEEKALEVEIKEEVTKTEEPSKEEDTKQGKEDEITTAEKEKETVEEKKEEVQPALVPVLAAVEENKPAVEEVKTEVVAAAPEAETPSTKVTAAKAPETLAAEPEKTVGAIQAAIE